MILAVSAIPVIVTLPVPPLILILDPAAILVTMPVKSAPLTAGNVVGNLPAGIVPTLRLDADTLPSKLVAVMTPVTLISLTPVISTPPVNVAAVPVIIFSVDATPVNPDPSPEKLVAVTTPVRFKSPVPDINFPFKSRLPPNLGVVSWKTLVIPVSLAVTVTSPADMGDTDRFVPKLIVVAVPTIDPPSLIPIPDPDPTTLVNPDPSPTKLAAVMIPDVLTLPVVPIPVVGKFVKLAPLMAGNDAGNLASGIVPDPRFVAFKLVKLLPSKAGSAPLRLDDANVPSKLVAVTTPEETIPFLAVITPTESIFVTSSYVRVPAIETFWNVETPLTTRLSAVIFAVFANPVIVTAPVAPLILILDPAAMLVTIPVKSAPLTAGNVAGNLASANVPAVIFAALAKLVAVVAVPVRLPVKDAAVIIPVVLMLPVVPIPVEGRLVRLAPLMAGRAPMRALAVKLVSPAPSPLKDDAVIIPLVTI